MEYYGNTQKKSFIYIDIKTAQNVLRARSNKQKQCYVWRHLGTLLSEPPGKSTIYICEATSVSVSTLSPTSTTLPYCTSLKKRKLVMVLSGLHWKREGFKFFFFLIIKQSQKAFSHVANQAEQISVTFYICLYVCVHIYLDIYTNIQMSTRRHAHFILILRIGVNGIFFSIFFILWKSIVSL